MKWLGRLFSRRPTAPRAPQISELEQLKAFLTEFEGKRLTSYECQAGVWTVGVGATRFLGGTPISKGWKISEEQCEALLDRDAREVHTQACKMLRDDASRGARIAFASLCFNFGWPRIKKSHAVREYNNGNMAEAERHFKEWRLVDGEPSDGLIRRRAAEWKLIEEMEQ